MIEGAIMIDVTRFGNEKRMTSPVTTVPVLLYHGVGENPSEPMAFYNVRPAEFREHLDLVVTSGRKPLIASEFVDRVRTGEDVANCVLITFDDGFFDFMTNALPALVERELAATLYVTTGWLEDAAPVTRARGPQDQMLRSSDLPHIAAAGIEVGAHSHTHPKMDSLSVQAAWEEFVVPRDILSESLGQPVKAFAYPHGYNSPRLRRQAREVGYTSAVAGRESLSHSSDDVFRLARLSATAAITAEDIDQWLHASGAPSATPRERLKTKAGRTLRRTQGVLTGRPVSDWS